MFWRGLGFGCGALGVLAVWVSVSVVGLGVLLVWVSPVFSLVFFILFFSFCFSWFGFLCILLVCLGAPYTFFNIFLCLSIKKRS